jgi:hypothetical protein
LVCVFFFYLTEASVRSSVVGCVAYLFSFLFKLRLDLSVHIWCLIRTLKGLNSLAQFFGCILKHHRLK